MSGVLNIRKGGALLIALLLLGGCAEKSEQTGVPSSAVEQGLEQEVIVSPEVLTTETAVGTETAGVPQEAEPLVVCLSPEEYHVIHHTLEEFVSDFEQQNPDISIVFVEDCDAALTAQPTVEVTAAPVERPIDLRPVLAILPAADIYDLAYNEQIVCLGEYLNTTEAEGQETIADFYSAFMQHTTYQGRLCSVPFRRNVSGLYYNRSLFHESGLAFPGDWDAWGASAQALTVREGQAVSRWGLLLPSEDTLSIFETFSMGTGHKLVENYPFIVYLDRADAVRAVQFYQDLAQKYLAVPPYSEMPPHEEAVAQFLSQETAMLYASSEDLLEIIEGAEFEVGIEPIPGASVDSFASLTTGSNLYFVAGANEAQYNTAVRFLRYLTDPEQMAELCIQTGCLVPRQQALETERIQTYMQQLPQLAEFYEVLPYVGRSMVVYEQDAVSTILQEYLEKAYRGEMQPEAALQEAQAQIDIVLKPYR